MLSPSLTPLYLALLRAALLRADPESVHQAVCLIYMHNYWSLGHIPCCQALCCDTLHLLHRLLLLLLPPVTLTVQRQVRTASWVSSGGTNPEEAMSTSSSPFQFKSSDSSSTVPTTSQGDESQHNKFHSQQVHPGCLYIPLVKVHLDQTFLLLLPPRDWKCFPMPKSWCSQGHVYKEALPWFHHPHTSQLLLLILRPALQLVMCPEATLKGDKDRCRTLVVHELIQSGF